jgi:2-oxoisovalerate dehydrogenase E1 component
MGLSINGYKSVVEMQFADFVSTGFNPIVNYLAKVHYRWGQPADVVIRMPCGGGMQAGPFHSQTNEAWFVKTPGLKVVYPAFPYDAKGLLTTAINDPNPVLFDLRTLVPLDSETIFTSVKKTGKVLIVHEDTLTAGFASDIAALIAENCFEYLDAPIKRLGSLDTPIPFTKLLEDQFMAKSKLEQVLIELMNY